MNWEGRVTHSQGDGVAHVSKQALVTIHHIQVLALLCNATSHQALHFSLLFSYPPL